MSFEKVTIGDAILYRGNCIDVLETLPRNNIDAVITDPPYSSGGQSAASRRLDPLKKYIQSDSSTRHTYLTFQGDNKDQRSFYVWCLYWLSKCFEIAKDQSLCCIFTDWRQLPITTDIIQGAGFIWRGIGVWDKTEAARPQKGGFRNQCEYVVWGSKKNLPTSKIAPGVWRKYLLPADKKHMTGKPIEIMQNILAITPERGVVLDPFMGSGTTGVSSLNLGRKFIGIEISQEYFDIACKRIEASQEQKRLIA